MDRNNGSLQSVAVASVCKIALLGWRRKVTRVAVPNVDVHTRDATLAPWLDNDSVLLRWFVFRHELLLNVGRHLLVMAELDRIRSCATGN